MGSADAFDPSAVASGAIAIGGSGRPVRADSVCARQAASFDTLAGARVKRQAASFDTLVGVTM